MSDQRKETMNRNCKRGRPLNIPFNKKDEVNNHSTNTKKNKVSTGSTTNKEDSVQQQDEKHQAIHTSQGAYTSTTTTKNHTNTSATPSLGPVHW